MYGSMAKYYDRLYSAKGKDYGAEARRLEALARRYGRSGGGAWLDVACGTGRHLAILQTRHAVAGVDLSREMLRDARRRLPGVPLHLGDMRSFRLPGRFDVVSCLFSAIGHLHTEKDLDRAFANFARHLAPGGVALVEPWIAPANFRPQGVHLVAHRDPRRIVVRVARSAREGKWAAVSPDPRTDPIAPAAP